MTTGQDTDAVVRVLCVDDEESILHSLQRLFLDEEFETITALSGRDGLELLARTPHVGVIISDQRMPEMLGSDFLHACCTVAPDAVRILLTGYADLNATIDAINKGGVTRYLGKPWSDEELLMIVRDAVKQYFLVVENRRLTGIVAQQNEELQEWNRNLKARVLQQTTTLRQKNEELNSLLRQRREQYEAMVVALAGTVKLRGKSLFQHASNVTELSLAVARELGVADDQLETIRIAALLHDIGKIGTSERILQLTPERMSPLERQEYSLHPVRGQMALDVIDELRPAGVLIRHHHERFDGRGFPDKLSGAAIPLGSRIIALADFMDRSLCKQSGGSVETVLEQARELCGAEFDPQLLRHFEQVARGILDLDGKKGKSEREVSPDELQDGMTLSRNIYSGSGVLLLKKGTVLDGSMRQAIQRFYTLDPSDHGVFVTAA